MTRTPSVPSGISAIYSKEPQAEMHERVTVPCQIQILASLGTGTNTTLFGCARADCSAQYRELTYQERRVHDIPVAGHAQQQKGVYLGQSLDLRPA
jgi:hypothetical protein